MLFVVADSVAPLGIGCNSAEDTLCHLSFGDALHEVSPSRAGSGLLALVFRTDWWLTVGRTTGPKGLTSLHKLKRTPSHRPRS